jgi:GTPase
MATRSGFVSFVGRPNVGKSTLTNALVGQKVAITSSKPQTTRRAIRAVVNRPEGQLILIDLPGIHRPRTLLGQRLNDLVTANLGDVDVLAFCTPANERLGPGDRRIIEDMARFPRAKRVAVVTKIDTVTKERLAEHLNELSEAGEWQEIIPVSALKGEQLELLADLLVALLPVGTALYPEEMVSEESFEDMVCELVREAALELVQDELPHSLAVTFDEYHEDEKKLFLSLWVERDSQKGIVIGKSGSMLKQIGSTARKDIEKLVGHQIHLAIQVRVAPDWQRNPRQLGKLGF